MTLIEFFSDSHIDNIAACLRLQPDKLIMIGDGQQMEAPLERYRHLLRQRGWKTEILACDVQGKDLGDICAVLAGLVRKEDACVIDLTGGETTAIMAVGAVLTGLDESTRERIRVEKYDQDADVVMDCVRDNCTVPYEPVWLTVEEWIGIHGGKIHPDSYQPPQDCDYEAVDGLWKLATRDPKAWNRAMMLLSEFESRADSKMQVYLHLPFIRNGITDFEEKEPVVRKLLEKFRQIGVISDYSGEKKLEYTYKDRLLRYCTQKAGNILEIKTLLEGRRVLGKNGPFFQDCRMSVGIDWDGVLHQPEEQVADTRNEIDVILMHGTKPLFVSCKNGNVDEEELYKLNTVADRFGGPNARKMLVATDLDRKSDASNRAFTQRAEDMDILVVADAPKLTQEEWAKSFKKAVQ